MIIQQVRGYFVSSIVYEFIDSTSRHVMPIQLIITVAFANRYYKV